MAAKSPLQWPGIALIILISLSALVSLLFIDDRSVWGFLPAAATILCGAAAILLWRTNRKLTGRLAMLEANCRTERAARLESEEARRKDLPSLDRFQKLSNSRAIGIAVEKGDRITEANNYFLELSGHPRADLSGPGIRWSDLTPVDGRHLAADGREQLRSQRYCLSIQRDLTRPDGSRVSVLISGIRLDEHASDSDPTTWETLYVIQDVTEQKQTERRLQQLADATGLLILDASPDSDKFQQDLAKYLVARFARACFVYTREDEEVRCIAAATAPGTTCAPDRSLDAVEAAAMRKLLANGTTQVVGDSGIMVPLPSRGRVMGALFAVMPRSGAFTQNDVRLLEEIGRRAGAAFAHARLYRQMHEASRLKDEFVSILSHELRTPLTPILGAVYMLRAEPDNKRIVEKALDLIERNAKNQARMVEDLLDVSRIISGKLRLRQEELDLPAIITASLDAVRPSREAKDIGIEVAINNLSGSVFGDPDRLQQVLWNLLSNSVKFTPKGGRIKVELDQLHDHAEIRVTDTGIGIAPDFLPFVFDRFRQEDGSRTRIHGGLGLGLAIVRHLVESHGGTVAAHSAGDQQGTTFSVRLPLRARARESAASRMSTGSTA